MSKTVMVDLNQVNDWLNKLNRKEFSDFQIISKSQDNSWQDETHGGSTHRTTVLYIQEGVFAEVVETCNSYGNEQGVTSVKFVQPVVKEVVEYKSK